MRAQLFRIVLFWFHWRSVYGLQVGSVLRKCCPIAIGTTLLFYSLHCFAQSGLESEIRQAIFSLVRILNIVIVGFAAWSGFLIARGDGSGQTRLIYSVIGLIVVNASNMIINYFI